MYYQCNADSYTFAPLFVLLKGNDGDSFEFEFRAIEALNNERELLEQELVK